VSCLLAQSFSAFYFLQILNFGSVLIHSPYGGKEARIGAWSALVEAQRAGQVRSIGVSNYGVHHLDELEEYINNGGGGKIDVGQYELHPWLQRPDIVSWLRKRNVVIQAYSPLTRTQRLDELVLKGLSKKHGKTPAQILLRWSLQKVCFIHYKIAHGALKFWRFFPPLRR
jgi:diketogulonate reductase-like aldo/keto reductase